MQYARLVHEVEQLDAALRDLTPVVGRMRERLMEEGFEREEAVDGAFRVLETVIETANREDG